MIKVNQQTFVSFQYVLKHLGMEIKRDVLVSDLQRIITFRNMKIIYTYTYKYIGPKLRNPHFFPPAPIPWVMRHARVVGI